MKSTNGKKPMLKPAIVIGVGGTGNQVIRRLKKRVADQHNDTPTLINLLVVDTDEDTFNDQSWAELPPLKDIERAPLYDPQVPFSDVRENSGAYEEIHEWLSPAVDVGLLDRQDGAGQIRMLGRVAFYKSFAFFERRIDHFFDQCQRIQTLLEAMHRYDFNIETDPVVYLISSVCGGQGAGSFIDAAVALRILAGNRFPRLNLIGVLTLPSVYADLIPRENWSKVCANTHAAVKEMDYLMHSADRSKMRFRFPAPIGRTITPQAPLFDLCYLIDDRHHRGSLNGEKEVYDQIASQLFLEIGTPFGARSDSIRVNLNTVAGIERDRVYNTGRRYSGFGNHTTSFDRRKIVELASLESASALIADRLLGRAPAVDEVESRIGEFLAQHRIGETETGDLLNTLITPHEISQELVAAAYSQERPDHGIFARDLWARFDAFWLRRAPEMRVKMEKRCRAKLDGADERRGILDVLDEIVDDTIRQAGVTPAHGLIEALLLRLRALEAAIRADHQQCRDQAQQSFHEAEGARTAITNIAQQLDQLRAAAERISLFSRLWRMFGYVATLGLWRPGAADDEARARQFHDLNLNAHDQRTRFLSSYNQAVEKRLAHESREAAAIFYSEAAARLNEIKDRLEQIKSNLETSGSALLRQRDEATAEMGRNAFVGGNTMRRDVSADFADQYQKTRGLAAADEIFKSLLPGGRPALGSMESCQDGEEIRKKFSDLYAEDIIHRREHNSLAEMINRFRSNGGGSLTDRIGEALRFCLPFWDIRVPGNQSTTEVLLVGLEHDDKEVEDYLESHKASHRGEVLPHIVPTGQDSAILISLIAHGASYYWHAQDKTYFREYSLALESAPNPIHLREEWRTLPEPIPDPSKYERRVFALGIAYEFIAVRGSDYYLDCSRKYSLVGSSRRDSPDWKTIPLLEAPALSEQAKPPVVPIAEDLLDDDDRAEAMQKFIDIDRHVAAVRKHLAGLLAEHGRDAMRRQIERYCGEVLEPAVEQLEEDDRARRQLELEMTELEEIVSELTPVAGKLKLTR